LDAVQYLIKPKADVNAKDIYETTPLHFAAESGYLDVVQYLDKQNLLILMLRTNMTGLLCTLMLEVEISMQYYA
jgi:ankyrin repeat protein